MPRLRDINEKATNHLRGVKSTMDVLYHSKQLIRNGLFRPETKLFSVELLEASHKICTVSLNNTGSKLTGL